MSQRHDAFGIASGFSAGLREFLAELSDSRESGCCMIKGHWHYLHIKVENKFVQDGAWAYYRPRPDYEAIRNHIAFVAVKIDSSDIDGN